MQHLAFEGLVAWKLPGINLNNNVALVQKLIAAKNLRVLLQKIKFPNDKDQRRTVIDILTRVYYGKFVFAFKNTRKKNMVKSSRKLILSFFQLLESDELKPLFDLFLEPFPKLNENRMDEINDQTPVPQLFVTMAFLRNLKDILDIMSTKMDKYIADIVRVLLALIKATLNSSTLYKIRNIAIKRIVSIIEFFFENDDVGQLIGVYIQVIRPLIEKLSVYFIQDKSSLLDSLEILSSHKVYIARSCLAQNCDNFLFFIFFGFFSQISRKQSTTSNKITLSKIFCKLSHQKLSKLLH